MKPKYLMLNNRLLCLFLLFVFFISGYLPTSALSQVDDLVQLKVEIKSSASTTSGKTTSHLFAVPQLNQDYNGLILTGSATGDYKQGFVKFHDASGWTDWQPLRYLSSSTEDIFLAGFRSDIYHPGVAFELRFDMPAGTQIDITEIGVFDNRLDEDHLQTDSSTEPVPIQQLAAAILPPSLIPRGEWGADSFAGTPVPLAQPSYNRMTFHHAACCGAFTYEEGITQVKGIQDFHQDVRGWSDIGYQFIFDQSGRLYQGRPFLDNRTNLDRAPILAQGAHVGGANTGNIGVAVLGCYHPPEGGACQDVLSPALRDSVVTMFAFLSEQYGVNTSNLLGHRDQTATSCPGDNNYPLLPALRTEIQELIISGNQPIAFASLTAENAADGVVQLSWTFSEVFDVTSFRIDRETETTSTTIFQSDNVIDGLESSTIADAGLTTNEVFQYSLYATSSTGVEQRLSSTTAGIDLTNSFLLGENFPNPFTTSSTLRYFLDHEGVVSLNVYDSTGRLVSNLVDTFQEGDQWYSATVQADNLANGTYFYRLQVVGFSNVVFDQTKAMVLAR